MATHTASQRYLSTRGGSYGVSNAELHALVPSDVNLSFEEVVLRGLASDGGLFIPEDIPSLPTDWATEWLHLSFADLACEVLSCYISPSEIPRPDLLNIVQRSYSSFREPDITPLISLDKEQNLHLLELFHGPTFAFKDVALQFLGNLFEYFLARRNEGRTGHDRHHLTVIGATSGDTGSAAIYGLRGKKDVSVFILHPKGKVSPVQEAQMTTVLDNNVHNLALEGNFDDCQDTVKALFGDPIINKTQNLAAVNSINWARILAQITYYFHAFFTLVRSPTFKSGDKVRFVTPTGNFGNVLAGYFAKRMGLPIDKLVVATNENDILHRFWETGHYEKHTVHGREARGGLVQDGVKAHEEGVKETLSPAMDILVSSNFERLLWFLKFQLSEGKDLAERRKLAGRQVKAWLTELKSVGGFGVEDAIRAAAGKDFESERVSDQETVETIKQFYTTAKPVAVSGTSSTTNLLTRLKGYILDPHSAIGVAASLRSIARAPPPEMHHVSLATAHPAKFANAVDLALKDEPGFKFQMILPEEFIGLEEKERRLRAVGSGQGLEGIRAIVEEELANESAR
ncbi:MAG: threonine synthase [Piccolia ochrophora]|nr:MAG: threonine synthase [Piccolia ochrophora]